MQMRVDLHQQHKEDKKMTADTKRAIEAISPLTELLNINVKADDRILFMNDQAIGIGCNSTWATLMEMIGYIFWKYYCGQFRPVDIDFMEMKETIMRYWVEDDLLRKLRGEEVEDGTV